MIALQLLTLYCVVYGGLVYVGVVLYVGGDVYVARACVAEMVYVGEVI